MNKRLKELEHAHEDVSLPATHVVILYAMWLLQKLTRLRNSYRTQLSDAVKKIAGEYKVFSVTIPVITYYTTCNRLTMRIYYQVRLTDMILLSSN